MARFTQNDNEIRHLVEIERSAPLFGIVRITLVNGSVIEGVIRGASSGNNFQSGMLRPTAYKTERTIQSLDGTLHVVDTLDVKSIADIWEQKKQAYADAGIITPAGW